MLIAVGQETGLTDIRIDKLRAWSFFRQGLDRPDRDPQAALRDGIAVYSSHPTAPLAVLARTTCLDAEGFLQLERSRQAIRLPAMRGSIFLLPAQTAPAILAATRTPMKKLQRRLDYGGLTWKDYERAKEQFVSHATSPMTVDELEEIIPVDGKLMVAVRMMAYEGLALRVGEGLRSDNFRYVSTEAWLGRRLDEPDPEESLVWLAGEYLRAFGPVRVADFAWWAGVTKGSAKKAFSPLSTVDLGDGLLLGEADVDTWEQCQPLDGDEIALLPKWDSYTMGYPADGRARFVRDEHQELAYPKIRATRGDGAPLVLRGGEAVAAWGHRFQRDRLDVTVTPFTSSDRMEYLSESSFEPVASLLGATGLSLTIESD